MIKHIVFFRLKEFDNPESRTGKLNELKTRVEALGNKIEQLVHIEAGINISDRDVAYDLALVSDFRSEDDLEAYRVHPAHQELVDYLKEMVKEIGVVDYIY